MNFYPRKRRSPQILIVSLIDIFAILLIFVLVSSNFRKAQPSVTINLPEAKTTRVVAGKREPIVITISGASQLFVDEQLVELEKLAPMLATLVKRDPSITVALNADRDAPFKTVWRVIEGLKEAGVKGNLTAFMEQSK